MISQFSIFALAHLKTSAIDNICSLCVRYCAKPFTYILLFNPHNNEIILLVPFSVSIVKVTAIRNRVGIQAFSSRACGRKCITLKPSSVSSFGSQVPEGGERTVCELTDLQNSLPAWCWHRAGCGVVQEGREADSLSKLDTKRLKSG